MTGQITLGEYLASRPRMELGGCIGCICKNCLYWWSKRCPYGDCWDDLRVKEDPYDAAHPDEPPRTAWSDWNEPGEQAHWCRGGACYLNYYCPHFVKYQGQQVKQCLDGLVSVFQDGYIWCSFVDTVGCQECYKKFMKRMERDGP